MIKFVDAPIERGLPVEETVAASETECCLWLLADDGDGICLVYFSTEVCSEKQI